MPIDYENINILWSALIIEALIRQGVDHFCISPGSRSAPLTIAAARTAKAHKVVCHDERAAAFYAIGYARATHQPAVLICTSGSAAAHYFPAVMEAAHDHLPLLILSADRPPELQQTGANQTTQQDYLFGSYAKWYFALPCPTETITARMVLTTMDQAVYQARLSPAGPVHINCPFREPLTPSREPISSVQDLDYWLNSDRPFTAYSTPLYQPDDKTIQVIAAILQNATDGLISIGRLTTHQECHSALQLVKTLPWPVAADITSGLRLSDEVPTAYFDQLLSHSARWPYQPTVILHIGGQFISKRLLQFIEHRVIKEHFAEHYIVIQNHPFRSDPTHTVSHRLYGDISLTINRLLDCLKPKAVDFDPLQGERIRQWQALNQQIDWIITDFLNKDSALNEIAIARLLSELVPDQHGLWIANSMPIRDMDMYGKPRAHPIRIGANRGTSGIDGTLASAVGFAVGLMKPVTVLVGDLAFLHDLNSLLLVKNSVYPVIVVIINNNGGGIFSFLPIAQYPEVFGNYFVTPHGLQFEHFAKAMALPYYMPRTTHELREQYQQALQSSQSSVIEIHIERLTNYHAHRQLQARIREQLGATR